MLGGATGAFVYNAKKVRPVAELARVDVMLSLEYHEQKHVRRQILGKASIEPEHLAVSRGAAVQLRKSLATQLILSPTLLLFLIPQAVPGSSDIWWLMAIGVCAQAVGVVLLVRDFRQTGRFLARTAD